MKRLVRATAPAWLLLSAAAAQAAPNWMVTEVSGDVRLSEGGRTRAAGKGMLLVSGATIMTGPTARAVIVRGGEFVVIAPATRIRVPQAEAPNKIMQLIEEWGSAVFKIEKKSNPHFGVQTPYLAAVVKGTTFTVTVGPEGSQVRVSEGAVEVTTLDGAASELIPAGGAAMVGKSNLYRLTVEGKGGTVAQGPNGRAVGQSANVSPRPAAAPAAAPAWASRGGRSEDVRISKVIREKKVNLTEVTGGLLEGGRGSDLAQGEFNENSRRALKALRAGKPDGGQQEDKGKPDKNKPEKDKPEKEKPDQKPEKDNPEKAKPDEKDKPDQGKDLPGSKPGGEKPTDKGESKDDDRGDDRPKPGEDDGKDGFEDKHDKKDGKRDGDD